MSKLIDEFGGRLFRNARRKGRKARNVYERPLLKPARKALRRIAIKQKLSLMAKKAPEVMVKISGTPKGLKHLKAHMSYIGREGKADELVLEDERGEIYKGKDDLDELADSWRNSGYRIPLESKKREAFNIVLSMPPGTDRAAVTSAAREFSKHVFEGHQYAFATHEDEAHPHVHLTVKAVSMDGFRLNPRKADLQDWRETFAEYLRDEGITANATRRVHRGQLERGRSQAAIQIDKKFKFGKAKEPSIHTKKISEDQTRNPRFEQMTQTRKEVVRLVGGIAKEFAKSESQTDKQIALGLVQVVKDMRPIKQPDRSKEQLTEKEKGRGGDRSE